MKKSHSRLDNSLQKLLMFQLKDYYPYYIGAVFALFFTHYIQSELPFYAKELAEFIGRGGEISTAKFFYLAIGIVIFRTSSRLLFFYPARILQKKLRLDLIKKLEQAVPFRYKKYSSGQLFQVIGNDMEELRALIGFALLQVANVLIALFVLVPKLNAFNDQLIYALSPILIAFVLFTFIVSKNKKYYRKTQDMQGELQNFIMESYLGKKTIKNFHAEGPFIKLFNDHSYRELINFYKASKNIAASIPFMPLGVGVSLLIGAHLIKVQGLSSSSLVLFSGFVYLFLEPVMYLSWIGVVFSRSSGAWARISELVKSLNEESEEERYLSEKNRGIATQRFIVKYWDDSLTLNFSENKINVFVGKTGVGKTEVIKQIAYIYMTKDIEISYVAQSPYLYNDTITNNIFLGQSISAEKLARAKKLLKIFCLDTLESDLDRVLSLEVGENGKRLSGGQAKRVCLVRSLLSDTKTLLWDDPFSSVDVILEKQIMNNLRRSGYLDNMTIILSTHRLTTVKLSDKIIYLEKEKGILEEGDASFLLATRSQVYEYFENQMV